MTSSSNTSQVETDDGSAAATDGSFEERARSAAAAWKSTTSALPADARAPSPYRGKGLYPFCLPVEHADHNLLPDARAVALERFEAAGIPWHHGVGKSPSNHLLSSQVQCANALAPHVASPDAIATIFGSVLPIADVLPFGADTGNQFDAADHVVFEWNGLADHLAEWGGKHGTRGANNTSTDAAIRYRNHDGDIEIALVEWKYREHYTASGLSGGAAKNETRTKRYRHLFDDSDGPIREGVLDFDDLLVEPMYQLMRQQLLAWKVEQEHELDAKTVRVCYCAPSANRALWEKLPGAALVAAAEQGLVSTPGPLLSLWWRMLRRTDRFVYFDTARLLDDGMPTSHEWRLRYSHLSNGAFPAEPTAE
jgi:hypothetical protein